MRMEELNFGDGARSCLIHCSFFTNLDKGIPSIIVAPRLRNICYSLAAVVLPSGHFAFFFFSFSFLKYVLIISAF